jgi:hypothetical protein
MGQLFSPATAHLPSCALDGPIMFSHRFFPNPPYGESALDCLRPRSLRLIRFCYIVSPLESSIPFFPPPFSLYSSATLVAPALFLSWLQPQTNHLTSIPFTVCTISHIAPVLFLLPIAGTLRHTYLFLPRLTLPGSTLLIAHHSPHPSATQHLFLV